MDKVTMFEVGSRSGWAAFMRTAPLVMGILNVTPDSFSDGGDFSDLSAAIAQGRAMFDAGADIVDIGGESTRPEAAPVDPGEEMRRVLPVVTALAPLGAISIDTRNAATMAAALDAGARIVNDVSGLGHDRAAAGLVAARACPVILMHMRGTPAGMNALAVYEDVRREVLTELLARRDAALAAGVRAENIALDPGFGFAKRGAQNLALLRALPDFAAAGHPLVVGVSRKHFIGQFGGAAEKRRRFPGSIAAGLFALAQGAAILRVHDVAETVQAVRIWRELTAAEFQAATPE